MFNVNIARNPTANAVLTWHGKSNVTAVYFVNVTDTITLLKRILKFLWMILCHIECNVASYGCWKDILNITLLQVISKLSRRLERLYNVTENITSYEFQNVVQNITWLQMFFENITEDIAMLQVILKVIITFLPGFAKVRLRFVLCTSNIWSEIKQLFYHSDVLTPKIIKLFTLATFEVK